MWQSFPKQLPFGSAQHQLFTHCFSPEHAEPSTLHDVPLHSTPGFYNGSDLQDTSEDSNRQHHLGSLVSSISILIIKTVLIQIKIQATPDEIPEGETPQTVHLCCYDELVDSVRPGDRIEVTGIYRAQAIRVGQ